MKLTGNTILITGGGSGIGRGLAEQLHAKGNQVIITGRRKGHLDAVVKANPGMVAVEMDVTDPASIATVTSQLVKDFPRLNVLINNAGIMHIDDATAPVDDQLMISTIETNLYGPIRVTSALIEHLKKQPDATIYNVSSVLGFVPLAVSAVYSATKAAVHSYTQSLRWRLQGTSVKVREIAPPWVQTDLLNSNEEPRAMPLAPFIAETMELLATDANEVLVENAKALRNATGPDNGAFALQFNDAFVAG
jgi:uncharacterized oxidoreductase